MAEAVKFIHASDFHLDEPMRGLPEIPQHLKTRLANAPYEAAQKVFDLALSERVDFVLLAGDLLDIEAGNPRSATFLLRNFERLAAKNIMVYWCAGTVDHPERWPAAIALPANVVTFSSTVVEQVEHRRDNRVIATLFGSGFDPRRTTAAEFDARPECPLPIALCHGEFETTDVVAQHIRYWALGGRHRATKTDLSGGMAVFPGTTQGRNPKETGIHGCKICRVDSHGKIRLQTVDTDCIRWINQRVPCGLETRIEQVKETLGERALKIAAESIDQLVLVHWMVTTDGAYTSLAAQPGMCEEILAWLREEFGKSETGVWSVGLSVEAPESYPSGWYEEDTILGEFLRSVGRYQSDDSLKLALHDYLPPGLETDPLAGIGQVSGKRRIEVLKQSAITGVQYLGQHKQPIDADMYEGTS